MTIFVITYDLINEQGSKDYQPLWDALAKQDCHRTQYSVWLGNFNNTAKQVHDYFRGFLDTNDRLMVCEFTKDYWYSQALAGTTEWLSKNPPLR